MEKLSCAAEDSCPQPHLNRSLEAVRHTAGESSCPRLSQCLQSPLTGLGSDENVWKPSGRGVCCTVFCQDRVRWLNGAELQRGVLIGGKVTRCPKPATDYISHTCGEALRGTRAAGIFRIPGVPWHAGQSKPSRCDVPPTLRTFRHCDYPDWNLKTAQKSQGQIAAQIICISTVTCLINTESLSVKVWILTPTTCQKGSWNHSNGATLKGSDRNKLKVNLHDGGNVLEI